MFVTTSIISKTMLRRCLAVALAVFSAVTLVAQQRACIAYCTWYGSALPDPDIVTNIHYAFAELYMTDSVYNGFKLEGSESRFAKVVALKKSNPNLKISLSFTHIVENSDNKQAGGFSALAANPESRARFAADCVAFVEKWGIDGIDIDWEFPGLSWSGAKCDPMHDCANFTMLLKDLRQALGGTRLLSFAGYVNDRARTDAGGYRYIDISAAMPYVDYVNIMTYDMDAAPHFQSAVVSSSSYYDCKTAIDVYARCGVPYAKMILGIPFYVRHSFDSSPTVIDYKKLATLAKNSAYKIDNWDDEARTPYVTYNGQFYGSYDNERSIAFKGEWANSLGLGGLMYWENSEDDDSRTLARAVWDAVSREYFDN